ncbi:MAG: M15 family metallopeptidase [Bacteroidia bacterium]
MHFRQGRFLLAGVALLFFVACGGGSQEQDKGIADKQRAEDWNKHVEEKGVPLAILDTLPEDDIPESTAGRSPMIDSLEQKLIDAGLVDVQAVDPSILLDLRYATKNNFLRKNVYGSLRKAYLQPEAADMLAEASQALQEDYPDLRLMVFDGVRPRSVQFAMWRIVKGTAQEQYVASPKTGSIHNFGAAVDLTIATAEGKALDMGTPFDFFGQKAQPRYEDALLASGELTAQQVENRRLLRKIMTDAGFSIINNEWWHFNAFPASETRKRFEMVE